MPIAPELHQNKPPTELDWRLDFINNRFDSSPIPSTNIARRIWQAILYIRPLGDRGGWR